MSSFGRLGRALSVAWRGRPQTSAVNPEADRWAVLRTGESRARGPADGAAAITSGVKPDTWVRPEYVPPITRGTDDSPVAPRQSAGLAKPGQRPEPPKRRRRLAMAVVSGVVVVALAVGGLWWFKWRDGQDGPVLSGPLLAEMSQPPSLAPVLRVDEIFDGELLEAGFLSAGRRFTIDLEPTRHPVLLDRDTVVAYALGYSFEPALQVAAVDARLGETKWVVDVLGALDQALPDGGFDELARIVHFLLLPDGQGGLLVAVRTQGYAVTLHLGPGGETMGARRGAFATAVAGDLVAFDDLAPDGNTVSVAPLAALDQDLWQAGSGTDPELVVDCPPLTADDGTLLVLTDQGYADGRTGRLLGFGSDHDGDSVRYGMAHSGVVLRRTTQYGESFLVPAGYTWSRLDPATGEELWTVDLQQNDYGAGVLSPDRIVIGPWLNFEPCSPGYNQGLVWDSVLERWLGEGTPGVLAVYEAATGKVAYGVDGAVVDVADSKLMIWQEAPLEPPETYGGYGKYVAFYQRLDVSTGSAESETSWMTDFGAADSCYYSGAGLDVSNPLGMDVWFSVSQSLMTGAPWGISAYDYSGPKGYLRGFNLYFGSGHDFQGSVAWGGSLWLTGNWYGPEGEVLSRLQ